MFDALEFSWAGLAGGAGVVASCRWPLFRTRHSILSAQFVSSSLWTTHYLLLQANTAAFVTMLAIVQIVSAFPERRNWALKTIFAATLPLALLASALSWTGIESAFTALALIVGTVARWQTDIVRMRLLYLACSGLWFSHNLIVVSIYGMVADTISSANNLRRLREVLRLRRAPPAAPGLAVG